MRLVFSISSIEKIGPNNLIVATSTTPTVEATTKSLEFLEKSEEKDDGKNGNNIIECTSNNKNWKCS